MKNENKKQRKHPIGFGILCVILGYLCAYGVAMVLTLLGFAVLRKLGVVSMTDVQSTAEQLSPVIHGLTILTSSLMMCRFYLKNRKSGYQGAIKVRGNNCRDVWIFTGILAAGFLARYFQGPLMMPNGLNNIHIGLSSFFMPICAGVAEEIVFRGIPVAVMMRSKPDTKRIRTIFILTAALFGVFHLVNGFGGANGPAQVLFTFFMGLFWGAVYLRTGSILFTIVFHVLYDLLVETMVVPDPIQASNIALILFTQILPLVFAFVILRKSKIEEIKETWSKIWSE